MQKLIYSLLKFKLTCTLYLFFKNISVIGREHIPEKGPFIFAVNHQNSFLDALVVNVTNARNPIFLARGDVFKHKRVATLLNFINILPIYRARDGVGKMRKNEEIFEKCASILSSGNPILIFPEANHQYEYRIRLITKGISRIAFSSSKTTKNLVIIPVGIHYEDYKRTGYPIVIRYGKPIHISEFEKVYNQNHNEGYQHFATYLGEKMRELVVDIPSTNYSIILDLWKTHRVIQRDVNDQLQTDQDLVDKISNNIDSFPDGTKTDQTSRHFLYLPFFIISCVVYFIPWAVTNLILQNIKDDQYVASIKVAVWFLLVPEIIILEAILIGLVFKSFLIGIGFLVLTLLTGWITVKRYFPL